MNILITGDGKVFEIMSCSNIILDVQQIDLYNQLTINYFSFLVFLSLLLKDSSKMVSKSSV